MRTDHARSVSRPSSNAHHHLSVRVPVPRPRPPPSTHPPSSALHSTTVRTWSCGVGCRTWTCLVPCCSIKADILSERHYESVHDGTVPRSNHWTPGETTGAVSIMVDPTVKEPKSRGKVVLGRQQSERTSVSGGTHSVKRERAEPRGLGVRTESARAQNFCFKSKRTEVPSDTPLSVRKRAKIEVNFVGPPTLPFFHAVPSGTASSSPLNDGR